MEPGYIADYLCRIEPKDVRYIENDVHVDKSIDCREIRALPIQRNWVPSLGPNPPKDGV